MLLSSGAEAGEAIRTGPIDSHGTPHVIQCNMRARDRRCEASDRAIYHTFVTWAMLMILPCGPPHLMGCSV